MQDNDAALIHEDTPYQDDSPWPGEQAQGSSSSHSTLANRTVISRIKDIIERNDEPSLTDYLRGEVAQTFVDVVHEVRPHFPRLLRHVLTTI